MKLHIENFQNIKSADIEFIPGINCIVGESNNGKTAILRAVKAIITNPSGSGSYLRHGAKSAKVELTNAGETLEWIRTKSSVSYHYNGQDFPKASKQTSDDFCNLGFARGSKGELMNLLDEWSVLFPFGYSDTELFKIFEDLFCITDSAKIIDTMRGDETSVNRDKLLHQDRVKNFEEKLTKLKELKSKLKAGQANLIVEVISKKSEELETMKKDIQSLKELNKVSKLELTTVPFKADELSRIGKQSLELFKACSRASQLAVNDIKLPEAKSFDFDLANLARLNEASVQFRSEANKKKNLEINQAELEKTLEELKARWDEIDSCPLCGAEMKHG